MNVQDQDTIPFILKQALLMAATSNHSARMAMPMNLPPFPIQLMHNISSNMMVPHLSQVYNYSSMLMLMTAAAKASEAIEMSKNVPPAPYSPLSCSSSSMIESPLKSECNNISKLPMSMADIANTSGGIGMSMNLPPAPYSPFFGSSFSMIESECSNATVFPQTEPLNMCMRDHVNVQTASFNSPIKKQTRSPRAHPIQKKSKSFKCNLCQCVYSCLNDLAEHTKTVHNGYRCHICNTRFTQRSNLQRHALRHIGFKPYTCGVCSREYYRKDHLIRHITFNHPEVVPKDVIVQRMSSSESLNFIDKESITQSIKSSIELDVEMKIKEEEAQETKQIRSISPMNSELLLTSTESQNSTGNVFLSQNSDLYIDVVGL